jgi:hypothetical protein
VKQGFRVFSNCLQTNDYWTHQIINHKKSLSIQTVNIAQLYHSFIVTQYFRDDQSTNECISWSIPIKYESAWMRCLSYLNGFDGNLSFNDVLTVIVKSIFLFVKNEIRERVVKGFSRWRGFLYWWQASCKWRLMRGYLMDLMATCLVIVLLCVCVCFFEVFHLIKIKSRDLFFFSATDWKVERTAQFNRLELRATKKTWMTWFVSIKARAFFDLQTTSGPRSTVLSRLLSTNLYPTALVISLFRIAGYWSGYFSLKK